MATNINFYGANVLNPEWWKPLIQDYLNNMLISFDICNTKCEAMLSSGNTVHFPQVSDVRTQNYTPGTDLTIDPLTATNSQLVVDQSKAVTFSVDPIEVKQANAPWATQVAYQAAYQLRNNIDQYVINTGITNASTTTNAGSQTTSTILALLNDRHAQLGRNNALDDTVFAVIDYDRLSLLTQTFVANGFNEADAMLRNQFVGRASGFDVYVTNNLPSTNTFTLAVNPTAGNTFTIYGVTWTYVVIGTATNAGEISIGAVLATTQASTLNAINGTGTPGAANYIDVSVDNRRNLQNRQLLASAFVANVSTLTGFGKMAATSVFTSASNLFGTETTTLLFGRIGAISLAIQMMPDLYIRPEPKQISDNYITQVLFGAAVFSRDTFRLTTAVINA